PDVHVPVAARILIRCICDERALRIARDPAGNLWIGEQRRRRALLRQLRRRRDRGDRRLDQPPVRVVDVGRGRAGARGAADEQRRQYGDQRETHQRCRNDQSLLPRKFSGVTSTIAIACEATLSRSVVTRPFRIARLAPSAATETTRNLRPW